MTASPIRRLLQAKPFVSFTLHIGFATDFQIDDPEQCHLDDDEMLLYILYPELHPPKPMRKVPVEPASVEVIDLRLVSRVSVKSEKMPD